MKSIQTLLQTLSQQLIQLDCDVYHYEKADDFSVPYIVWAEQGEDDSSFNADNHKKDQVIQGTLDFYTETEFDSLVDTIQETLDNLDNCGFMLNSVLYEDNTKLIHYSWNWELI